MSYAVMNAHMYSRAGIIIFGIICLIVVTKHKEKWA